MMFFRMIKKGKGNKNIYRRSVLLRMGLFENAIISLVKFKLDHALDLDGIKPISSEGIKEFRDIAYTNRAGKQLLMDIYEPVVEKGTELPVVINIHGGALIED